MLRNKAYNYIKSLITSGEALPNEILSENKIAKDLNISRSPVRDATQLLEKEGLVVISPKRGVVVSDLSLAEFREISQLRESVETYIVKSLINNNALSNELFQKLDENILLQKKELENSNPEKFMLMDTNFHFILVKEQNNKKFLEIMINFYDRIYTNGIRLLKKPGRMKESVEEHQAIVDCLKRKDVNGVIKAVETHFINGRRNYI